MSHTTYVGAEVKTLTYISNPKCYKEIRNKELKSVKMYTITGASKTGNLSGHRDTRHSIIIRYHGSEYMMPGL